MLHDFLTNNRTDLIVRCQKMVATRQHAATAEQLLHGVPLFLDQLVQTLRSVQPEYTLGGEELRNLHDSGAVNADIGASARLHGEDMLSLGFTVDEVVHNYGDLCQAITTLAVERDAPFSVDEFRTLNRCLDDAIAHAVTAFSRQHDVDESDRHDAAENKRMGFFVHELRNLLGTAKLAFSACKAGALPLSGATGGILGRSFDAMEGLINSTIDIVRDEHHPRERDLFSLAEFVAEVGATASLAAIAKECRLRIVPVDRQLAIQGHRPMLLAAVVNLLQNAFKYTHPHTEVILSCQVSADRILIDVADHCGGIGPELAQRMFQPFEQGSADRSGLGLGLTIARQFITENGGYLSVRDLPSIGCVFTVSLPRHAMSN
ncbi:sensor histidine kinase [Massilia eburnea]|uniref:sensor histidine kinase n=1 Tax=Massilia eburnea TaxID=1776165 RepID=UPI001BA6C7DB|nr:HAMP domain-containing sensor histidine kinase [Massilia eburnea]